MSNLIQEEIKGRLNSGNACYHSVQNLLSFRLLYKNITIIIYKTIILAFVLYECETWSLTLREEHRLRVFENRAWRMFGPKRSEVTGGWIELLNEELHGLYSSPSIIKMIKSRRMRLAGHVARIEEDEETAYRILVGKPGKKPLGRSRRRWVDNIKMDLIELGWDGMDWTDMPQDMDQWRVLVNTVMNLRVPQNARNFLSSCRIGGSSKRDQLHE
ncbi:hypothetical protein B7P43_G01684 [Cryptotermes secundus]|uniref:Uncharacterized protein n=1 Tax=Cryptotermes secundus TaxID=105785 RepID=A0A2J7PDN0_9NEOP|nr:hypothetical protein B7P43_G01684 [Cryptotermes secundus]